MKRQNIIFALLIGLFIFTSCDEIKRNINETFRSEDDKQKELSEAFENYSREPKDLLQELKKKNNILLEEYKVLIGEQFSDLSQAQQNTIFEMVKREVDNRHKAEISLIFQPQKLDKIQEELYQFLNTDEILLYPSGIHVSDDRVRLTALNPLKDDEVDWYFYETETGKWRKEDPRKLSARDMEKIAEDVYSFREIKLRSAHQVYKEGLKRLTEIEGAELPYPPTYYNYSYKKHWSMTLKGSRADYNLEADREGNVTKFEMR